MTEYVSTKETEFSLKDFLKKLQNLREILKAKEGLDEKHLLLDGYLTYEAEFFDDPYLLEKERYLVKSVFAIRQGERIFDLSRPFSAHKEILKNLDSIETFYSDFGGIIGYQCLVLTLLLSKEEADEKIAFYPPQGKPLIDENDPEVKKAILVGIRHQDKMAEFYPVGGAADRLALKDGATGKGLPAACLIFQGKHLLEGMVHDLQAREYLYFKLFSTIITTPIALMTSEVNRNHFFIRDICEKNNWFNRKEASFRFFKQPSVPVFTKKGEWCLQKPMKLLLRPGGHGVIWKLAQETGIFDWLQREGKSKVLVRQINNPMAAVDYGLSAFLGVGHQENKAFGFASCERRVDAHEGMNVLKVTERGSQKEVVLTNVEYCDFEKYAIEDKPKAENSHYSLFPSNTNILFADLEALKKALLSHPFPGLLLNFREGNHYVSDKGLQKEELARLETTMQNIADAFQVRFDAKLPTELPTYVTFNERRKTISTTKRKEARGGKLLETPEGCFYDFMQNAEELLGNYCKMKCIPIENESSFLKQGPAFLMSYHPALGPFYSIIQQKIRGGEIVTGSEMQLEIADLYMHDLFLDGSLLIFAEAIMGHLDDEGHLVYSNQTGQCNLKNVRVENEGIDWNADNHLFWKHEIKRQASLTIHLKGHSRFDADGVTFKGNQVIEVPDKVHMIAFKEGEHVRFETKKIDAPASFWSYTIEDNSVKLS